MGEMIRGEILKIASECVCSVREDDYGSPEENFKAIAETWSWWLGQEITAHDVTVMMALLKIGRLKTGKPKDDTYIDACGYLALAGEIKLTEKLNEEFDKIKEINFPKGDGRFEEEYGRKE